MRPAATLQFSFPHGGRWLWRWLFRRWAAASGARWRVVCGGTATAWRRFAA